jgi:hypothetical protein
MTLLFSSAYQTILAIAKAVLEIAKTGIYPLDRDLFNEVYFIRAKVSNIITATTEIDRAVND